MSPRRIGIIGLGTIARYYLAAIERMPGWELGAVCDLRPEALAPHADRVPCYADHLDLLREAALDAVVVTAPNDAHAALCRDALLAGLPVCVEKPLGLSAAEGRSLAELGGPVLFTAFHRR